MIKTTLSLHRASGNYYRTVKTEAGRRRIYLGKDHDVALETWFTHRAEFEAGRDPRKEAKKNAGSDRVRCIDACTKFLDAKKSEVKPNTFALLRRTCQKLIEYFGENGDISRLGPEDFLKIRTALDNGNPCTFANEVQRVRQLFIWLDDHDIVAKPKFGSSFSKPSKKRRREHMLNQPNPCFEARELRAVLAELGPVYRAAVLLCINGAGTQEDALALTWDKIKGDLVEDSRVKTGEPRKYTLWPETAAALELVKSTTDSDSVIPCTHRQLTDRFTAALQAARVKRAGLSFRSLRHTFATIARQCPDDTATRCVMGHTHPDVLTAHYTHAFPAARVKTVCDHVRSWLFDSDA